MVRNLLRNVVLLVLISFLVIGCQAVDNSNVTKLTSDKIETVEKKVDQGSDLPVETNLELTEQTEKPTLRQNEYLMNLLAGIPTLLIGILILKYLAKRSKDKRSKK